MCTVIIAAIERADLEDTYLNRGSDTTASFAGRTEQEQ